MSKQSPPIVLWLGVLWLALVSCTSLAAAAPPPQREQKELFLEVGQQLSLSASGVKSYSLGASGIVDLRLSKEGDQFVLVALQGGVTTLLFFMLDGREVYHRIEVEQQTRTEEQEIRVSAQDNIRLDFYFVQVSQEYGHQLGLAFPGSVGGSVQLQGQFNMLTGTVTDASLGIAEQILPRLDLAQDAGWARIARQAALVAENGKQAQFQSGGEVNVRVQGALTAEVRAISYGSTVTVQPRFDRSSGRIELTVGADVSDLTADKGTGIPGRLLAKLETVVNLDLGKSLVLAGLNSESETKGSSGLPGLHRIPILGGLFGSKTRRSQETKNLLFIVPSVVQAVALSEQNLIEEMLRVYQGFSGDVGAVSLLSRTPKAAGKGGAQAGAQGGAKAP